MTVPNIEKVKEKKEVRQAVKSKDSSKPKELLYRGLQDIIEKTGKNIREAGELPSQEEKPQYKASYGVDKTEVVAKLVASNAYARGRKLAQKQKKTNKFQQQKTMPEAEVPNESVSETPNYDEARSASYTVSVGENLSETSTCYVENNGINSAEIKLKTELEKPLAGGGG